MAKRQLRLGAFMRPVSIHTGAWRYPGAWPDANFNFAHIKRLIQKLEARKVRRLLHGRPSRRAQHAGQRAEAQPHRDLVRAVHAVVGAGRRHRADRADRHRLDHLRRALSCRAPLCLARPHQRRPRRLEHRHHLQSRRGAEFRARRPHGARRALQAARANSTTWSPACGIPSPTTPLSATSKPGSISIRPGCMCSITRANICQVRGPLNIARPVQGWPVIVQAGASDDGTPARRRDRGSRVHRRRQPGRRAKALCRHQGPHGQAGPRPRPPEDICPAPSSWSATASRRPKRSARCSTAWCITTAPSPRSR